MQNRTPEQKSWQKIIANQGAVAGTSLGLGLGTAFGVGVYFFSNILKGYSRGPEVPLKLFRYTASFSLAGMALGYGSGRLFGFFADKFTGKPASLPMNQDEIPGPKKN